MKQKFIVEVKFSAMNEMSLYERLRNAVFEWQTTEPKVRSVSVVPAPQNTMEQNGHMARYAAALEAVMEFKEDTGGFYRSFQGFTLWVTQRLNAIKAWHCA